MRVFGADVCPNLGVAVRPAAATANLILACALSAALAGCSALGSSGPSTAAVKRASGAELAAAQIQVIDLTDAVARRVIAAQRTQAFSNSPGDGTRYGALIGPGDVLDISIWEAPPAVLFGASTSDLRLASNATSRGTAIPEQMVDAQGMVRVPFVGDLRAAGRSSGQIEREIEARLAGMAHRPEAIVRIVRNAAATVTVVGDVTNSARVPLTTKGERLLDVLAAAGGVKQPVGKTTIQLSRAGQVVSMPLDTVIRDPSQNIRLQADDVVTALYQPFSFTALGAVTNNAEIPFEGVGITLSQALGRIGGLQDSRADVKGVFLFRLENPAALDPTMVYGSRTTPDGKIPVIYRLDLRDPSAFFVAQGFPIRNKDVIYVSNAPIADLQKFTNIVSSMAFSIIGIANSLP